MLNMKAREADCIFSLSCLACSYFIINYYNR